jgi:preprotein translocase subunit SecA
VKRFKIRCEEEKKQVIDAGGLYIIGTERHESRRIDNQLRGRSGRQGDPGESMFYLSLEDNLMRIFNGERIQKIMTMLNIPEDEPITHKMVTNAIEGAQRKVEGHNFDMRKHLLDYDDVMNQQRNSIYKMRRNILDGRDLERTTLDMLGDVVSVILDNTVPDGTKPSDWNVEGLNTSLLQQFGFKIQTENLKTTEQVQNSISDNVKKIYEAQKKSMGPFFEQITKMIMLNSIDLRWKEHLYTIDKIKEGVGLRGYAQKDPLIEYKKEAFRAFDILNNVIKSETVEKLMRVQLVQDQAEQAIQNMRPDEIDMDELNFSSTDQAVNSFQQMQSEAHQMQTEPAAPTKRRMIGGPPRGDERPQNRADRRKGR